MAFATPYYDPKFKNLAKSYPNPAIVQKSVKKNVEETIKRIGAFGNIIFETSDKKILTFDGFTQKISGRWATHERIGLKSKQEFTGPALRTISFNITLNAVHGIKPREMLESLEKIVESGTANTLVIGTRAIGENKWILKEISETWDVIFNKGELFKATLSLLLEEYL
ncbi:phage tail protein [Clostridium neonatale]|uniref:phage tail protein n=1 Tax=Clostridium neonatale TaxID=137838 RepID=UPI00291B3AE0|nr:phage tail protein [Clostridium neonatale]CAI3224149.1 Phage protein U [Clostridium neonatale]CAI3570349.1 Phage protein U [Clostridium neonatale]CAI3667970.1 Phage protein U [Clostridium neonatale]CAI3704883.1 Phage protein U [Clostridium neonatale]CAI3713275.1 Phage protein U [Clostridium neonatale]